MANLERSQPIQRLPGLSATANVVPAPQKKSAPISPGLDEARIIREPTRSSATGFILQGVKGAEQEDPGLQTGDESGAALLI